MVFVLALLARAVSGQVFTLTENTAHTAITGCNSIDLSTAKSVDMSATDCNSLKCPDCYVATAGGNKLTITNCHYIPVAGATSSAYVRLYNFSNHSASSITINDGTNDVATLTALGGGNSHTKCLCKAGSLACK
eukprot:GEMP01097686.1.p1 GENE.GEMP01097686.1~~GEMP01097686.1.p1  ORF type:complete len:134 (+),score=17.76 GEMP01097686.1:179-580(+)